MTLSTLEYIERDRQRCNAARQIRQQEILMALKPYTGTGHKTKLAKAKIVDGKLEIEPSRAKLPPHVKYAKDKKQRVKRGPRI